MCMTSSRVGAFVIPASNTKEEPRDSMEISWLCFSEDPDERAEKEVNVMASVDIMILEASSEGWRRKECHEPERTR